MTPAFGPRNRYERVVYWVNARIVDLEIWWHKRKASK